MLPVTFSGQFVVPADQVAGLQVAGVLNAMRAATAQRGRPDVVPEQDGFSFHGWPMYRTLLSTVDSGAVRVWARGPDLVVGFRVSVRRAAVVGTCFFAAFGMLVASGGDRATGAAFFVFPALLQYLLAVAAGPASYRGFLERAIRDAAKRLPAGAGPALPPRSVPSRISP